MSTKLFYITNSPAVPKPIGVMQDPLDLQGIGEIDMKQFGWDGKTDNWLYDLRVNPGIFSAMTVFSDIACTKPLFVVAQTDSPCYIRVRTSTGWDDKGHYVRGFLY